MKQYVLAHPDWGVFLGVALGLGFFSLEDSVGQTEAVAFVSEEEAQQMKAVILAVNDNDDHRKIEIKSIECSVLRSASIAECMAAGLPGWLSPDTPTCGGVQ